MVMRNNPCKACTEETGRCIGCHSTCQKYIEASEKHVAIREAYNRENRARQEYNDYMICVQRRWQKNRCHDSNGIMTSKKR